MSFRPKRRIIGSHVCSCDHLCKPPTCLPPVFKSSEGQGLWPFLAEHPSFMPESSPTLELWKQWKLRAFYFTKILLQLIKMGILTSHVVRFKKHDCRGHVCSFLLPKKHNTARWCAQKRKSTTKCLFPNSPPLYYTTWQRQTQAINCGGICELLLS